MTAQGSAASPRHLIICGSPRPRGHSARFAELLARTLELQGAQVQVFFVSEDKVSGCLGCGYCDQQDRCVIDDPMTALYDQIRLADAVHVATPIYFSGVPSQLKAILDRFQVFFQQRQRNKAQGLPLPPKRPLHAYLFGEGGDPHGHDAALSELRSAFAIADCALEGHHAFIGDQREAAARAYLKELA